MNEQDIKKRVLELLKYNRISVRAMAARIGMPQQNLNNQINRDIALSMKTLILIMSQFPNVSAEWLLRGTGEMFLDGSTPVGNNRNEQKGTAERVAGGVPSAETYIADLQRQIAELRKDKELLGGLLQQLTGARKCVL